MDKPKALFLAVATACTTVLAAVALLVSVRAWPDALGFVISGFSGVTLILAIRATLKFMRIYRDGR